MGILLVAALMAVAGLTSHQNPAQAADHGDPDGLAMPADPPADLADFYAWHRDGSVVFAITLAGARAPDGDANLAYDRDVLHEIHVDNTNNNEPDISMTVRFGQDGEGNWGVQVGGIPGASEPIEGAVETTLTSGEVSVFAGLRDDPFFFDVAGFTETVATGTLAFASLDPEGDGPVDGLAGANATVVVIEVPTSAVLAGDSTTFNTWATSGRIGS